MDASFDGKDADNGDQDTEIEDEEPKLDHERAQTTEYPIQNFFTRSKVQDLIEAGITKSKYHRNAPMFSGIV